MYSVQILIMIILLATASAHYEDEYSKDLFHLRALDGVETEYSEESHMEMARSLTKSPPRFYKCLWKICSKPLNNERHELIEATHVKNAAKMANFVNNSILSLVSRLQNLFKIKNNKLIN